MKKPMTRKSVPIEESLDKVAGRLWEGHASVMVGAGFSKNAIPDTMPSWDELARIIYERLYHKGPKSSERLNPLALAEEFEVSVGLDGLNKLLADAINDEKHSPSELHIRLLELPWSDVFTTNYDTLLERAYRKIVSRNYDIVEDKDGIAFSRRPRIVKLHGSLPDHTPFIITNEQYRTYPVLYAPFVNTVQQSMMENVLCLVGFSGSDPNFHRWVGWIRDNLGDTMPDIYMIGLLNLNVLQETVLLSKGIVPVDLSKYKQATVSDPRTALVSFLTHMESRKPRDPKEWPTAYSSEDSPESDLLKVALQWKKERKVYPGWVVLPSDNRTRLWIDTIKWLPKFNENKLDHPDDIISLYELQWRLRKCLVSPQFIDICKVQSTVKRYNPFPQLLSTHPGFITPEVEEYKSLDWDSIKQSWIELILTLAKHARIHLDHEQFGYWMMSVLNPTIVSENSQWLAEWYYEKCMYHLTDMDLEQLSQTLDQWPVNMNLPFYEAKRAGLLGELGDFHQAECVAEQALNIIRAEINLNPVTDNYTHLSKEGLVMWLLEPLKDVNLREDSERNQANEQRKLYFERWKTLSSYQCDPWKEKAEIDLKLHDESSGTPKTTTYEKAFDGHTIVCRHWSNEIPHDIPAGLEFANFFEEAGIPFLLGNRGMVGDEALVCAARQIGEMSPAWCTSMLIRKGCSENEFNKLLFDRVSIARLDVNEIDRLLTKYISVFTDIQTQLPSDEPAYCMWALPQRAFRVLVEIISRLVIRCSEPVRKRVLDIAIVIYNMSSEMHWLASTSTIGHLFQRTLGSMRTDEILFCMADLLSLEIPTACRSQIDEVEPFLGHDFWRNIKADGSFDRSSWSKPIGKLIHLLGKGTDFQRSMSCLRLSALHDMNALTPAECHRFSDMLWQECHLYKQSGLPGKTRLLHSSFLHLPAPEKIDVKLKVKHYLLGQSFVSRSDKEWEIKNLVCEFHYSTTHHLYHSDCRSDPIDWDCEEAVIIFNKILEWWSTGKEKLSKNNFKHEGDREQYRKCLGNIPILLAEIVVPRLKCISNGLVLSELSQLISELTDENIPCVVVRVASLAILPDRVGSTIGHIKLAAASSEPDCLDDAHRSITIWYSNARIGSISSPPEKLINELSNVIYLRQCPGLASAISNMCTVIDHDLANPAFDKLLVALEYLKEETSIHSDGDTIPLSDRPGYRASSTKLATSLNKYYLKKQQAIPKIIEDWKLIAQTDPLPEVRNSWHY